jgi:hypothetical protein
MQYCRLVPMFQRNLLLSVYKIGSLHIPEDSNLHSHHCENLYSHKGARMLKADERVIDSKRWVMLTQ